MFLKTLMDDNTITIDYTITPVKPVEYISITTTLYPEKMSWKETLKQMYLHYGWSTAFPEEGEKLAELNEAFQKKFPGNYTLEEFYNAKLQRFDVRLKFFDPKDETLFLLKHSG